ncbi:MAG: LamG-like jellyroll fold domain-containing protein [Candidatus Nanoarchaeia archaeon]
MNKRTRSSKQRRKTIFQLSVFLIIVVLLLVAAIFVFNGGSLTGRATGQEAREYYLVNKIYSENSEILFSDNVTSFRVTGSFTGEGSARIYLNASGNLILVYEISGSEESTGMSATGFVSYGDEIITENVSENESDNSSDIIIEESSEEIVIGENITEIIEITDNFSDTNNSEINITEEIIDENVSEEIIDENIAYENITEANISEYNISEDNVSESINETEEVIVEVEEETESGGDSEITEEIINETITEILNEPVEELTVNESLINESIIEENLSQEITFELECMASCSLMPVQVDNIVVEVDSGELEINEFVFTSPAGELVQILNVENVSLTMGVPYFLNVADYFNGRPEFYDFSSSAGYTYYVDGPIVVLTPQAEGVWPARAYAAKEGVVINSNDFFVIVSNFTVNETINETMNLTENLTINETIIAGEDFSVYVSAKGNRIKVENEALKELNKNKTVRLIVRNKEGTFISLYGLRKYIDDKEKGKGKEKETEKEKSQRIEKESKVAEFGEEKINKIKEINEFPDSGIEVLELNIEQLELLADAGYEEVFIDLPMQMALFDTINIVNASVVQNEFNLSGKNISICLVDTGVNTDEPFLEGVAVNGYDFVNGDDVAEDNNGHGTNMAAIMHAMAPDAEIVAVKVLDDSGSGYSSTIIAGIDYCRNLVVENNNLKIISMSLGGGAYEGYCDVVDPVASEASLAAAEGLFVVAAAGNDGAELIASPACGENVTAVSSTTKQDTVSSFSNVNGLVDLFAPGEGVVVFGNALSGTSVSAAHVSGLGALLLEYNASLSGLETGEQFRRTGKIVEYDRTGTAVNYSRIDIYNAILGIENGLYAPIMNQTNRTNMTYYEVFRKQLENAEVSISSQGDLKFDLLDDSYFEVSYGKKELLTQSIEEDKYKNEANNFSISIYEINKDELLYGTRSLQEANDNVIRHIKEDLLSGTQMSAGYSVFQYAETVPTIRSYFPSEGYVFYGDKIQKEDLKGDINYPVVRYHRQASGGCPVIVATDNAIVIEFHKKGLSQKDVDDFYAAIKDVAESYDVNSVKKTVHLEAGHLIYYMDDLTIKQLGRIALDGDSMIFYLYLDEPSDSLFESLTISQKVKQDGVSQVGSLRDLNENIDYSIRDEIIQRFAEIKGYELEEEGWNEEELEIIERLKPAVESDEWTKDAVWEGIAEDRYLKEENNFEYEVTLKEKPTSNVLEFDINTKGLDFYYQPELTAEEKAKGEVRPPEVIGSYAVYYDEERANNEYKTGKAFHIFRPRIIDNNNSWTWGELSIDERKGVLSIEIPSSWLEDASYPVIVDPTFGYTGAGASYMTINVSNVTGNATYYGTVFSTNDNATINLYTAYTQALGGKGGGEKNVQGYIYSNQSLEMLPNGISNKFYSNSSTGLAWVSVNFDNNPDFNQGEYILFTKAGNYEHLQYDTVGSLIGVEIIESWDEDWSTTIVVQNRTYKKFSTYVTYAYETLSCGVLSAPNSEYLLTASVSNNSGVCFNVTAANVTIDCAGFSITGGNNSYGVYSNQFNTKVKNCNISNFTYGIYYYGANNGTVQNTSSSTSHSSGAGILLQGGSNHTVINSTLISYSIYPPFWVNSGTSLTIVNNTISGGGVSNYGLDLYAVNNSNISNNYITANTALGTILMEGYNYRNVFSGNTIVSTGDNYSVLFYSTVENANNTFVNNTFISSGTEVYINAQSGNNIFYWNNFTNTSSYYVQDLNGSNKYNYTINATNNEGNIWFNVLNGSINITGNVSSGGYPVLYVGGSGSDYPYSNSTSGSKLSCIRGCTDYAPLTNKSNTTPPSHSISGCVNITSSGEYNITSSFAGSGNCVNILVNNVFVEGNYSQINGTIYVAGVSNVTIRNLYIDPDVGLLVNNTNASRFVNISYTNISSKGIWVTGDSNNNNFTNININTTGNGTGIYVDGGSNSLFDCSGGTILGVNGTAYGVYSNGSGTIIKNCVVSNFTNAIQYNNSASGSIINNTLKGASGALLFITGNSGSNVVYWNNFTTTSAYYVNDTNGTNSYNTTISSHGEGNVWANVLNGSVVIMGVNASSYSSNLYYGTTGSGYPYNASTSGSKVYGVVDYAPLTNRSIYVSLGACGTLSTANTAYVLINNLSNATATCLTVSADNVSINCAGLSIIGGNVTNSYGIVSTKFNTSISNCTISNFSRGIYFNGADNGSIQFVNATTTMSSGNGLLLGSGANSNIVSDSSFVSLHTSGSTGISVSSSSSNIFSRVYAGGRFGFSFSSSNSNQVFNSSASNESRTGVYLSSSESNNFSGVNFSSNTEDGAMFYQADNNIFTSCILSSASGSGINLGIAGGNDFTNCNITSGSGNSVYFEAQAGGSDFIGCNFYGPLLLGEGASINLFANSTIDGRGTSKAIMIYSVADLSYSNSFINNTIRNASVLLYIDSKSGDNLFYWNNFSNSSGDYVQDLNGSNKYNFTINSSNNEGNIWENVISGGVVVKGTLTSVYNSNLYIGSSGSGYPYSNTTSGSKLNCTRGCTDYAPLTNQGINAPVINSSRILPSTAYANSTLKGYCSANDTDGDDVSYYYQWYVGGTANASGVTGSNYTQATEVNVYNISSGLVKGQSWILSCKAYDGYANSSWLNSSALTISNLAPTMNSSRVLPTTAYTNDTLKGYCSANDTDGDNVSYYYLWYVGGVANASGVTSFNFTQAIEVNVNNITSGLVKGQSWILSCRAYDGEYNSSWMNSSARTISNTPPPTPTHSSPSNASRVYGNSQIVSWTPGGTDADGDTITYYWRVDVDAPPTSPFTFSGSTTGSSSSASATSDGSVYYWNIITSDGQDNLSATNYWSFTENTKPSISGVAITPAVAYAATDLNCSVSGWGDANGDSAQYYFQWYNGSILKYTTGSTTNTSNVLKSGNLTAGDVWNCTVTPYDGYENGTALTISKTINSPPAMNSSRILPLAAYANDTLRGFCSANDTDGDNVSYYYLWYVGGTANASGVTGSNFTQATEVNVNNITGNLVKGQSWILSCKAYDGYANSSWLNSSALTISNSPPSAPSLVLNASSVYNSTKDNLTVYISGSTDIDADSIWNITDWRINGQSLALINMPFNTNVSNTTSGAVRDYSANAKNGTLGAGTWTSGGIVGGAYSLDGDSDYIDLPNDVLEDSVGVSVWFKTSDTSKGYLWVYDDTDAPEIRIFLSSNTINCAGYDNSAYQFQLSTAFTDTSSWHHAVCTWEDNNAKFYLDGALIGSDGSVSITHTSSSQHRLGYYSRVGATSYFNGLIDEFMIFNRSISPEQVNATYQAGLVGRSIITIVSNETELNEVWSVAVTPTDTYGEGTTVLSNNITIINYPPVVSNVVLSATSTSNITTDNLSVTFSVSDNNGDAVYNITDWRKNGASIAVLNMPFDTTVSNTTSGAVRDYSTYANNGTLGGGNESAVPTWTANGQIGGAYSFDGGDYIELPSTSSLNVGSGNWTIAVWSKTSQASWGTVIGGYTGYKFILYGASAAGTARIEYNTGSCAAIQAGATINDGNWHHIAAVRDYSNNKLTLYVDGAQAGVNTDCQGTADGTGYNINIGRENRAMEYFTGSIDNVIISNLAFSSEQINSTYQDGLLGKSPESIMADETSVGDIWSVAVTPTDGTSEGATTLSNNLTIGNTAPAMNSSRILPATAYANDTLRGYCSANDTDGNNLTYYYQWYVGGVANASGVTGTSYTQQTEVNVNNITGNLVKGQSWILSCKAYDGYANSSWLNSSALMISNLAPYLSTVSISPTTPNVSSTLLGYCNASDTDNDNVSYYWSWYKNGAVSDSGNELGSFSGMCYQETANVSTACGGLSTGSYGSNGSWHVTFRNISSLYDGDWNTYNYSFIAVGWFYINYTKPVGVYNSSLWQVKFENVSAPSDYNIYNLTIPSSCWNYDDQKIILRVESFEDDGRSAFHCYNGSWISILDIGYLVGAGIYEEAMYWNISGTPAVNHSQGVAVNMANKSGLSVGDSWIFSCRAYDGSSNSSVWLNSSAVVVVNYAPVINSSRILPSTAYANSTLLGYCSANDSDGNSLYYNYMWYKSSVLNLSGATSLSFTQATEVNVNNITSGLAKGQSWILSCQANDTMNTSSWLNSSAVTISNLAPVMNSSRILPTTAYTNDTLQGFCSANDTDGDNVSYYYQWYKNGAANESGNELSGGAASLCYQESANVSTACGGLNTGAYNMGGWADPGIIIDGNWSSGFAYCNGYHMYVNYSKPTNAQSTSMWQVSYAKNSSLNITTNLSIDASCWNYDSAKIVLRINTSLSGTCYHCFWPETKVWLERGYIPIKDVKVGDKIYSYYDGKIVISNISEMHKYDNLNSENELFYIYTNNSVIKATWNHLFYVEGEYIYAKDLKEGQYLLNTNLLREKIIAIEKVPYYGKVYDIEVEETHNYFAENLLVHNGGGVGGGGVSNLNLINFTCYNGTDYVVLLNDTTPSDSSQTRFYEEAMYWNISTSATSHTQATEANVDNLTAGIQSKGEEWIFSCRANDGASNSSVWKNSSTLTISNLPPPQVTLDYPENNDSHFINRTPTFNWSAVTDPDGDNVTYEIYVSSYANFSDQIVNQSNIGNNYYAQSDELTFRTYYWKVRAHDGTAYGEWSDVWNFTLESYVSVDLISDTIAFGSIYPGDSNDTSDDAPAPFVFVSTSNTYANMYQFIVNETLWDSVEINTSYWQMKARTAGNNGTFNESASKTEWFNITNTTYIVKYLNYSANKNNVSIDVGITAPTYESIGVKSSTLIFNWGDYNS